MSFVSTALRVAAGPIVWALHFAAIYGFAGVACARSLPAAVPWAVGVATLLAGAACLLILHRELRRTPFTSWLAAGLAAFALLAVLWEAAPGLVVPPCV